MATDEKRELIEQILGASSGAFWKYLGRDPDGKKDFRARTGKISPAMIDTHLNGQDGPSDGKTLRGLGFDMLCGNGQTRFCILDLDNHDGTTPDEDMRRIVDRISDQMGRLTNHGIPHKVFRSTGGKGFQIWVMFAEPVPCLLARQLGFAILGSTWRKWKDELPVKSGTGGLFNGDHHEIEIFPKGEASTYNVQLPFFHQFQDIGEPGPFKPFEMTLTVEQMKTVAGGYFDEQKKKQKKRNQGRKTDDDGKMPDTDVAKALECFLSAFDPDSPYDQWKTPAMILKAAFEDTDHEGEATLGWINWSMEAEDYDLNEDELQAMWDNTDQGKFDELTFWRIATKNGYEGGSPIWEDKLGALLAVDEKWHMVQIGSKVCMMEVATRIPLAKDAFDLRHGGRDGFRRWMSWPGRTFKNGLTLEPLDYDGPMYNSFIGFDIEPKPGDVSLFLEYVAGITGRDHELAKWTIHWLADMVQRPTEPSVGTAISMRGRQGTGKGTLGAIMRKIIGDEHSVTVAELERLIGKFNDLIFGKTLVTLEEAIYAGNRQAAAKLKEFVTGEKWVYERKHISNFTGKNVTRIISTTNEAQANLLDVDDRRWTVLEVKAFWTKDRFVELYGWLNDGGASAILDYLLKVDVDRKLISAPISTVAKGEDKVMASPVLSVLVDFVEQGFIDDDLAGVGRISLQKLKQMADSRAGRKVHNGLPQYGADVQAILGDESFQRVAKVPNIEWQREYDRDVGSSYWMAHSMSRSTGIELPVPFVLKALLEDALGMPLEVDMACAVDGKWAPADGPNSDTGQDEGKDRRGEAW